MAKAATILLIEDDPVQREALRAALALDGHHVAEAEGIRMGLHLFRATSPSLVVLDLTLADGDGLEALRKIRAHPTLGATPVIVMTGRSALQHKDAGFEHGADQYLVKPVEGREVRMWVKALLRRVSLDKEEGGELSVGQLTIDPKALLVRWGDATISTLTRKEFELLAFLVQKRPKVLSRPYILSRLWRTVRVDKLVDAHVYNLRKKLPPDLAAKIQTVPGAGFRFFGQA